MQPLEFTEAVEYARILHRPLTYRWEACQRAHDLYRSNYERAKGLLIVPGYSFMMGRALGDAEGKARYATALTAEYLNRNIEIVLADQIRNLIQASGDLENIANIDKTTVYDALEDTLKSVAIQTWAATEAMAERLHKDALTLHPQCFPSAILGKKFYFRRLGSLFESYEVAFDNHATIRAALINADVKGLALLRHLLVHQNGIADQPFVDQCNEPPKVTAFGAVTKDVAVPIKGVLVRSLVDSAVQRVYELLNAVDGWLEANKP